MVQFAIMMVTEISVGNQGIARRPFEAKRERNPPTLPRGQSTKAYMLEKVQSEGKESMWEKGSTWGIWPVAFRDDNFHNFRYFYHTTTCYIPISQQFVLDKR
jgi:hypothetical protein